MTLPDLAEIKVPLRGKLLRDRYVLRVIAINKFMHFLFGALVCLILVYYALNRAALHDNLIYLLNAFRQLLGENVSDPPQKGMVKMAYEGIEKRSSWIAYAALGVGVYSGICFVEMFGLWFAKRWAEYLTLFATSLFLIPEVYELTGTVTALKVFAFVVNLVIVIYLLFAKHLFGIRGGAKTEMQEKSRDVGWSALGSVYP